MGSGVFQIEIRRVRLTSFLVFIKRRIMQAALGAVRGRLQDARRAREFQPWVNDSADVGAHAAQSTGLPLAPPRCRRTPRDDARVKNPNLVWAPPPRLRCVRPRFSIKKGYATSRRLSAASRGGRSRARSRRGPATAARRRRAREQRGARDRGKARTTSRRAAAACSLPPAAGGTRWPRFDEPAR